MLSLLIWKIVVNQANDFNRLTVIGGIYCFYLQTIAIQLYSLPYECRKLVSCIWNSLECVDNTECCILEYFLV